MDRKKLYITSYQWGHERLMTREESIPTIFRWDNNFIDWFVIEYSFGTNNTKMHVEDRKTKNKIEYVHSGNDTTTRKQSIYSI